MRWSYHAQMYVLQVGLKKPFLFSLQRIGEPYIIWIILV